MYCYGQGNVQSLFIRSEKFLDYIRNYELLNKVLSPSVSQSVSQLTLRLLMSYIYGAPTLDVSRSHTTTQHSR